MSLVVVLVYRYVAAMLWSAGCPYVDGKEDAASPRNVNIPETKKEAKEVQSPATSSFLRNTRITYSQFDGIVTRFGPLDRTFLGRIFSNIIQCVVAYMCIVIHLYPSIYF